MKRLAVLMGILVVAGAIFAPQHLGLSKATPQEEKAPEGVKTKTESQYYISVDTGGVPQRQFVGHSVQQYDEKGKQVERAYYNGNGKLSTKWLYKYDGKGNCIEVAWYDADGKLFQKELYKYDENGKEIEWSIYDDGKLIDKWMFDENGNWVRVEVKEK